MAEQVVEQSSSGFVMLHPGASFDLPFRADPGAVSIEVMAKRAFMLGPPVPDPDDPQPPVLHTDGGIRVEAIPPESSQPLHVDERLSGGSGVQTLAFIVSAGQQGTWICRCTNIANQQRRCRAIVAFTRVLDVSILTTPLSLRLLNHTLAALLRALSPRIVLDDNLSTVDISEEARRFLGGFEPITFKGVASNLELDRRSPRVVAVSLAIGGGRPTPALCVDLNFVPRSGSRGLLEGKVEVSNVRVVLTIALFAGGELGSRQIFPDADARVFIDESELELFDVPPAANAVIPLVSLTDDLVEEFLEHVLHPVFGGSDADVIRQVTQTIESKVRRPEVLHPLGAYITEALRQLVDRSNAFYDVVVEHGGWTVAHVHKDPPGAQGDAPPDGRVVSVPPVILPGPVGPAPADGPVSPA